MSEDDTMQGDHQQRSLRMSKTQSQVLVNMEVSPHPTIFCRDLVHVGVGLSQCMP